MVLILVSLVGLLEPCDFSFFSISGCGMDLDYWHVEWFALGMSGDLFVVFEIICKYCVSDSLVDIEDYSIPSKGFLLTVVNVMVVGVKFSHSRPF